jgi:hypothetical protein
MQQAGNENERRTKDNHAICGFESADGRQEIEFLGLVVFDRTIF